MKYSIIYADPPWSYRDKANDGARGAGHKYPVMGLGDLYAMRHMIDAWAAEDCVMFMWATFPMLPEAFKLLEVWGFRYSAPAFVWVKTNKRSGGLKMGMGNWTRSNAEPCLLATRGKPRRACAGVHSVIQSPIQEHSRKPDEARTRIVQLLGDLPRIELFARQRVQGWDAWGNEV